MGHSHDHHHSEKNIKVAFFLNLFFALVELVGGFLTNSIAITSDALHDLGDSLSLGIAWYFQRLSGKSSDKVFTFGYKRFSILGSMINSLILLSGSFLIIYHAVPRILDPVMPDATGMIWLSFLGISVNGLAAFRLMKSESLNERAVYLHLLEDVLGWVVTLLVSVILRFYELPILDPLLSIGISIFIMINAVKILKKSVNIMLQRIPDSIKPNQIESAILENTNVKDIHDCHIWTLDGNRHILSIHVVLNEDTTISDISKLKKTLRNEVRKYGIDHATFEFELENEDCDNY